MGNRKKNNWLINNMPVILLIFILFSLAGIIISIERYSSVFNGELSNDSNDWQSFGSFLEGTVGSFLSLINVCVTIYIAFIVKNFGKNQDLEMTKLNIQLRYYDEFSREVFDLIKKIELSKTPEDNLRAIHSIYTFLAGYFKKSQYFLNSSTKTKIESFISVLESTILKIKNKEIEIKVFNNSIKEFREGLENHYLETIDEFHKILEL